MSNANAVAQRDPIKDLQTDLSRDTVKAQFALALPAHITPDKFVRTLMTAVAKNPDLANADRRSLFNSCLEAAADGLMPNGKEAALVIFNTKEKRDGKDVWVKKVQYMPMVRGIRKLAFNSGQLKVLDAFCVHANDHFDYEYGFDPNVTHKPPKLGQDRGPIIGVYAVSETKDGERSLEVMDRAAVEKVRSVSRSKDSGPWVQWWDEMARKTVLRRLAKRLPLSEELERVINRDDALYEVSKRREADAALPPPTATAAGQLSAFAAAPALEHQAQPETYEPPQQVYQLISLDGEVIAQTTSSAEWLARFEAALGGAEDPARLWDLNTDAAEWAADMTEGGDETLARLRKAYLEPRGEQAGQQEADEAGAADGAAPPADEWADELADLKRIGATCQTFGQWQAFIADYSGRVDAIVSAGDPHAADWTTFAKERVAALRGKK